MFLTNVKQLVTLVVAGVVISGCSTKSDSLVVDPSSLEVISDYNSDFENRITNNDDDSTRVVDLVARKFKDMYEW